MANINGGGEKMKKKLLAKSHKIANGIHKEQSVVEHTGDVVNVLDKIAAKIDFRSIDERFEKHLKVIAVLHDLGKINKKFQNKIDMANRMDILENKERLSEKDKEKLKELRKEKEKINDERHNLLSGAFLKYIFDKLDIDRADRLILSKAIMLHHGSYEKYLEISNSQVEKAVFRDIEEGIFESDAYDYKEVEDYLKDELGIEIDFNDDFLDYEYMSNLNEDFQGESKRQFRYIACKGFLNLLDHLGSTQIRDFSYFNPYDKDTMDTELINNIKEKTGLEKVKFKPMQKFMGENIDHHVLTVAFTGSGKTAADYRWLGKRKVFLVPNKISAESFYQDAEQILGEENVGLLHGDISLYVEDENVKENNEGISLSLRDISLARNFAKSYLIATVDQIMLSMFKYPGYEKTFASVYDSHITIDEIHLLEPKMFLIMIYFVEFASKYLNAKFHLMTATLPDAYKEKIEGLKNSCGIEFIESNKDEVVEENKKVQLNIVNESNRDLFKIVDQALEDNKKVLIVKNTVKESIKIFNLLEEKYENKEIEINLLHSRFKFEDKKEKFKDILKQRGHIWVSTQSVEIALDLDFPVLISDNAPLDAIIQRIGRCNRHDRHEFGLVYVVDNKEKDVYDDKLKKQAMKLLKKSNGENLSMKDRKELLEDYYESDTVKKYYKEKFLNAEDEIRSIFGLRAGELDGEKIVFNYEPYLNLVDNKKEAGRLFRDIELNVKVILESDFERLRDGRSAFKEYQKKSVPVSKGVYFELNKHGGLKIEGGKLIVKDKFVSYDNKRGLVVNKLPK